MDVDSGVRFLERYPELDTVDMRGAVREWLVVAQDEGKALSAAALTKQLQVCAKLGPDRALRALENSAHKRLAYVVEAFPERTNGSVGPQSATRRRWGTDLAPGTTQQHVLEAEEEDRQMFARAELERIEREKRAASHA